MSVEGFNGLETPRLPLFPLRFGPDNWLPIRCKDQASACVCQFDAIARRLPHIEEERALNGVLVRAGFDVNARFQEQISRAQDIFALVSGIGDMVKTPMAFPVFFGAGQDRRSCC